MPENTINMTTSHYAQAFFHDLRLLLPQAFYSEAAVTGCACLYTLGVARFMRLALSDVIFFYDPRRGFRLHRMGKTSLAHELHHYPKTLEKLTRRLAINPNRDELLAIKGIPGEILSASVAKWLSMKEPELVMSTTYDHLVKLSERQGSNYRTPNIWIIDNASIMEVANEMWKN